MDTESFMLMRLLDGRVIRELVKDSPPPVDGILLIAPSDCTGCYPQVMSLLEARRKAERRIIVLLSTNPDTTERKQLLLANITTDGILSSSGKWLRGRTPTLLRRGPSGEFEPIQLDRKRSGRSAGSTGFSAARATTPP
jgi:hypothetical protein